jgi:polyhydroxyalkanoate synthesis repressor PhaR
MPDKRIIKRYTNRKLYDKQESRYVTLEEIARLVREGEDVAVIDNETEEDLTAVTFAQIILEEEKRKTNFISVPFLRKLIRSGEARVQDFSEAIGDLTEKAGERMWEVVEGSGKAINESISFLDDILEMPQKRLEAIREKARRSVEQLRLNPAVRKELDRVVQSLRTLEEAIARIAEEGRKQEKTPGEERSQAGSGEPDSNGYATPAGTIRSVQSDDEHQPFPAAEEEERPAGGQAGVGRNPK